MVFEMSDSDRELILRNFNITNAGLFSSTRLAFVCHWDDRQGDWCGPEAQPPAKVVVHNREKGSWGAILFGENGFSIGSSIAGGKVGSQTQGLVVDSRGIVVFFDFESTNGMEGRIPKDVLAVPRRVRLIGEHWYAASFGRKIAMRSGPNHWMRTSSARMSQEAQDNSDYFDVGFEDITGFDEAELYACGGEGDLWRYDGVGWHAVDLPCNWRMERICVGDGQVYVVGFDGEVLTGRAERWHQIISEAQGFNVENIAWFQGRLYAVTHHSLLVLDGERWRVADLGGEAQPASFGYLDATDEVLMVAGPYGASLFDGERWDNIIGGTTRTELLQASLLREQVGHLEKLRDALEGLDRPSGDAD